MSRRPLVAGDLRAGMTTREAEYIVVGAGSAGCVLANRLSAGDHHRVLLLEAGGSDRRFWIRVPIGYGRTFHDPRVNWMYRTEPDAGIGGRRSYWPRGRVLGGSGSINAMVYVRGQPADYDEWAARGNPGWAWRDVLPYFMRSEDNALGEGPLHGVGGPMHVNDVARDVHPICEHYLDACRQLGLKVGRDLNGHDSECAGLYQVTTRNGIRVSPATAFLDPARGRRGLTVLTGARTCRIVFDGNRAVGVEYLHRGRRHFARATKEVVLSAGAIGSPQLLQLSGVGPGALLRRHGIEPVAPLAAVGRNLQDHLGMDFLFRSHLPTLNNQLHSWWGKLWQGLRYVLLRRGPLALSVNQGGGFVRTRAELERPNLQLYFSPVSYTRAPVGKRPLMNPDPFPGFLLGYSACRPTSRGWLEIGSSDPLTPPAIHPGYLSTPEDMVEMLEGMRFIRRLAATPALTGLIAEELQPGPAVRTDAQFVEDIRARAGSVFHPTSTCAMGPDAATSVVDGELRVHGVQGLRVIDASVFPFVPSGNTNAPVIMVAEKGADLLLGRV